MSSFHKPKIYRSPAGCCICRAKSSSSRFTDSKKYEEDFLQCFQLDQTRIGEICNACVLLVKRWKKLPKGSIRHWAHVVDARAGPGTKSMNKCKKRDVSNHQEDLTKVRKKHVYKRKKKKIINRVDSPLTFSDDASDVVETTVLKEKAAPTSSFVDLTYWKRKDICCGMIYVGLGGEVMIDHKTFTPCSAKQHGEKQIENIQPLPQTIESIVESELKKFGYEDSEEEIDDSEEFYSDLPTAANKIGEAPATDIDEGFFDRPTASPEGV